MGMPDWTPVVDRLEALFEEVRHAVTTEHPEIQSDGHFDMGRRGAKFRDLAFTYDADQQWFEDLVVRFEVTPADNLVRFTVARGDDRPFVTVEPMALPGDDGSAEYQQAVLDYAEQAAAHTRQRIDVILSALGTPYFPGVGGS